MHTVRKALEQSSGNVMSFGMKSATGNNMQTIIICIIVLELIAIVALVLYGILFNSLDGE
jgi:hypothetical protein